MAEPKTSTKNDPRASLREARKRRLRLVSGGERPATVKVFAANETMREVLRHANGTRFREDIGQGVEWPNDSFTARRIKDGSVRTDGPGSGDAAPDDETLNARQQAHARREAGKAKQKPAETSHEAPAAQQAEPQHGEQQAEPQQHGEQQHGEQQHAEPQHGERRSRNHNHERAAQHDNPNPEPPPQPAA